jgi:hypothetical protein
MDAAFWRLTLATVLALLGAREGWAGPILIIGNEPQVNDGTFSAVASLGGGYSKAVGFTMPAESIALDSITLRLKEQAGSSSTLTVALFGGGNDGPSGPSLVSFNTPSIPTVAGDVTFTPTSPFLLKAGTTYWLDVTGTSNTLNGIVWYASNPGFAETGIATAAGARFDSKLSAFAAMQTSTVMNTFQVVGSLGPSPVPEPPGLVLAVIATTAGLAYAGWCRRRRSLAP